MRIVVNKKTCLRSSQCSYLHPSLFKQGEDGFPVVLADPLPEELRVEAEDAVEICPSMSIEIEEK